MDGAVLPGWATGILDRMIINLTLVVGVDAQLTADQFARCVRRHDGNDTLAAAGRVERNMR